MSKTEWDNHFYPRFRPTCDHTTISHWFVSTHFEHIFVCTEPFWCYVIQCVSSHSTKILIHITIYIWNYYGLWAFGLILRQNRGLWRCYIEEREKHTRFKSRTCVRITSRIYDSFKNEIRTGQKHKGNVSSSPKSKPNQMG